MLSLASRPKLERLPVQFPDQPGCLRPFPQAGVTMPLRAGDPPPLAREPVRLANDQHCKLRLSPRLRLVVNVAERLAQLAHLGPREMMSEQLEHLGVADRLARLGG